MALGTVSAMCGVLLYPWFTMHGPFMRKRVKLSPAVSQSAVPRKTTHESRESARHDTIHKNNHTHTQKVHTRQAHRHHNINHTNQPANSRHDSMYPHTAPNDGMKKTAPANTVEHEGWLNNSLTPGAQWRLSRGVVRNGQLLVYKPPSDLSNRFLDPDAPEHNPRRHTLPFQHRSTPLQCPMACCRMPQLSLIRHSNSIPAALASWEALWKLCATSFCLETTICSRNR